MAEEKSLIEYPSVFPIKVMGNQLLNTCQQLFILLNNSILFLMRVRLSSDPLKMVTISALLCPLMQRVVSSSMSYIEHCRLIRS